ncbi:Rid family hydrolase [Streptomyces marincola]|uniref:Rid family hydrolase n=1 Tax=Streptomyces marincola TaxID=2878388 RepID=UPI001CF23250|nr:Rid family hydrolase [Streptomyces marincola]UCM87347.1 RidA family protein [Streptomyces marincola]
MTIERVRGGTPWQESLGSARAVAAGDLVLVAGTAPQGAAAEGDPYEQAASALGAALSALGAFGLDAASVVRTRLYLVHGRDAEDVARAHRELLGATGPAVTLVVVSGFAEPGVLVEVELEAYRGAAT